MPASRTLNCDCPFCPLTEINLHVDDIKINLPRSSKTPISWRNVQEIDPENEDADKWIRNKMLIITLWARNSEKLKVNNCLQSRQESYSCYINRYPNEQYTISFHTHEYSEDEDDIVDDPVELGGDKIEEPPTNC